MAGRLTADLILSSAQGLNCIGEYELDLRGNKLNAVENLAVTQDQFRCIDLSSNDILKLEGFPPLKKLHTLLLNNNRVARIGSNLGVTLPNLETLVLTNNRLCNLGDLDPLVSCSRLERLSLVDNPVQKKPNYRLYVVHKLQKLKMLDFQKVKQKEREEAERMFGGEGGAAAAEAARAKTFTPGEPAAEEEEMAEPEPTGPTPEQLTKLKVAIANAATFEEVQRLEKALTTGVMPAELTEAMQE
mmetsp:Transcript_15196/g.49874  ORF Transcript_15196/g.49874 Transcript_15196/m.49874 type:complete len:244 (+) Transcript_15196:95-826(+)